MNNIYTTVFGMSVHGMGVILKYGRRNKDVVFTTSLSIVRLKGVYNIWIRRGEKTACYRLNQLSQIVETTVNKREGAKYTRLLRLEFEMGKHGAWFTVRFATNRTIQFDQFMDALRDLVCDGQASVEGYRHVAAERDAATDPFDPQSTEFVAVERFDPRVLAMSNLSTLVLENCVLSALPEQIGQLPLSYVSLSGSDLRAGTPYERDTIWDWMSGDTVCGTLTTLRIDSVGLSRLPFEIRFLDKLETLSVAHNNLKYLPQYIGELKKLQNLFIHYNKIKYFPSSLLGKTLIHVNMSENPFISGKRSPISHICFDNIWHYTDKAMGFSREENSVVSKLSDLAFYSLTKNCIKFKRQDLPRIYWNYFDVVGRCEHCHQFVLPDYAIVNYRTGGRPKCKSCVDDYKTPLRWLSLECRFKCLKEK